jgi:hypothetical protein
MPEFSGGVETSGPIRAFYSVARLFDDKPLKQHDIPNKDVFTSRLIGLAIFASPTFAAREGGVWKKRMLINNVSLPPAKYGRE